MKQVSNVFTNDTLSVMELLNRNGVGLYIPVYQREYSWDEDNINQLIDDVQKGIEGLVQSGNDKDKEIRFLGTIISVKEQNKKNIEPVDYAGIPESVEKIIDGQQRLTTILIFSVSAYCKFKEIEKKLIGTRFESDVKEIISSWTAKLIEIICLDLKRGTPNLKPKLIRGSIDKWIKDGDSKEAYKSEIASLLSALIDYHVGAKQVFDWKKTRKHKIYENKELFDKWLGRISEESDESIFKITDLIDRIDQKDLWSYDRENIVSLLKSDIDSAEKKSLIELSKLCLICHYLLERSVFVLIQPSSEDWAFDMFQSLNASGTPLTSIETFKPYVVFVVESKGLQFKHSESYKDFEKIEKLFDSLKKANDKNKRTADFLINFANTYSLRYKEISSHFTSQRKWLNQEFDSLESYEKRIGFVKKLGTFAEFMKEGWYKFEGLRDLFGQSHPAFSKYDLFQKFLIESKHFMSVTILGRFYSSWVNDKTDKKLEDYLTALSIITAFYTLWRSAYPNSGLDSVYRNFFKQENLYWQSDATIEVEALKKYIQKVLEEKGILTQESWINKACAYLSYSNKSLVRFNLLMYFHDTMPSNERPGLHAIARDDFNSMLDVEKWTSKDLKSIEHVAPKNNANSSWDPNLYDDDAFFDKIGNLTLLPIEINTSASDKGFLEKSMYYNFLGCEDEKKQDELKESAKNSGLDITQNNIDLLVTSKYTSHLDALRALDKQFVWDKNFVIERSKNIFEINFKRLSKMLE